MKELHLKKFSQENNLEIVVHIRNGMASEIIKSKKFINIHEFPIEVFNGWEVYKNGKFLGWINSKKKTIEKIRVDIKMSEDLKKLYKRSVKHWNRQILYWNMIGEFDIGPCPFCETRPNCGIDKNLCTCHKSNALFWKIVDARYNRRIKEMYKLAKKLRKELKRRSK